MREFSLVMKTGSTYRPIESQLTYADGSVVDLTVATAVELVMRLNTITAIPTTLTGAFVDKPNGKVTYIWQAGDTDIPGIYYAEWKVTFPSGVEVFPSKGFLTIYITNSLETL